MTDEKTREREEWIAVEALYLKQKIWRKVTTMIVF
jgi:hypothetical protein